MTTFQFNAAYPGSGKTEAALRYAIIQCGHYQQKALFILPTIALIKEQADRAHGIIADLGWDNVAVNMIFSEKDAASVKRRLLHHLETTPHDEPEVLFITLRSFLELTPWPNQHVWRQVYVDEAFNPFEDHSIQLMENFRVLMDRLELVDPAGEFSRLRPRHGAGVRDSVNDPLKRGDAVNQLLHPILARVLNPNFSVYADVEAWKAVAAGMPEAADPRILLFSEINAKAFEGFDCVTFMGAWLQNHAFFRLWRREGHEFQEHRMLARYIRNRLWDRSCDTIVYLTEHHWTRAYAGKPLDDGRAPLEHMQEFLKEQLAGLDFGWTRNAKQRIGYEDGVYIPPRAAGLNGYSDLQVLVWHASLLPHPAMWRFLTWRGMTDDEVRMEFYWLPLAQFMTRGADRRPDYDGRMIKVVPDLPAAQFLQGLFRSQLKRAGTIPVEENGFKHTGKAGRPKGHPNRGGRPKSRLTSEQRRDRRRQYERKRYAAKAKKPTSASMASPTTGSLRK
jgi:hypothetical protein